MTVALDVLPVVSSRSGRRWLVLIAAVVAGSGIAAAVYLAPDAWAADAHRNLQAARDLAAGQFGRQEGYLYSPLAAALTVPATLLPTDVAVVLWLALRAAVLAAGVVVATRSRSAVERLLVGLAAFGFVPIVYDLELGNVTILVAAALSVVAWRRDRSVNGILLGIVLATVPKPQLVPVLLWMLVWRPRSLVGACVTAAALTAAAALALGIGPYQAWVAALEAPPYLASATRSGDFSIWAMPTWAEVPAAGATILVALLAFRRGQAAALVAATAAGLLLAPYTIAYAAGLMVVPAHAWARRAPRATAFLALSSVVLIPFSFQAWAGACLVLAAIDVGPRRRTAEMPNAGARALPPPDPPAATGPSGPAPARG